MAEDASEEEEDEFWVDLWLGLALMNVLMKI